MQPNIHTLVKPTSTKRYKICLYFNHTEPIIKYFATNLINHITTEKERASRLLMPAFENKEREWKTKYVNF